MSISANYIKEFIYHKVCFSNFDHAYFIVNACLCRFVKKAKKRQKVLPTNGSDQDLRQSNVGKGHMNLEAVE